MEKMFKKKKKDRIHKSSVKNKNGLKSAKTNKQYSKYQLQAHSLIAVFTQKEITLAAKQSPLGISTIDKTKKSILKNSHLCLASGCDNLITDKETFPSHTLGLLALSLSLNKLCCVLAATVHSL